MPNFLVELSLSPFANSDYLFQHAFTIQSDALRVEGVVATKRVISPSLPDSGPDRLILNMSAESSDRLLGFSAFARIWTGVTDLRISEVVMPVAFGQGLMMLEK